MEDIKARIEELKTQLEKAKEPQTET